MKYTQVSKGSSGGSVTELQKLLNKNGYSLSEDGVFGDKTLAAVKDYQTKNGLTVDGIVGNNTWGALTGANTGASNNKNNASSGFKYDDFEYDDFSYGDYQESDIVKQANAALGAHIATKPGAYQSQRQGQIGSVVDKILNREDFSYDVNGDALYQQYKDQYSALGKLAMQDTMGQAAAMTGGYGSSYASSAGNQAYQSYLSQLNEVVPELYGMALDKYNQEGQDLYNQYGILADQENQDYARYQDKYNQWASERDNLQGVYNDERSFDYGKYTDGRDFAYGQYSDDRNLAYDEYATDKNLGYQEYRNAIEDEKWEKEFAEEQRQYNESMSFAKKQYEEAKASAASSGSGGSGGSGSGGSNQAALEHVASMSSKEIVETMQDYSVEKDNTGLASFLDDCVASGRLTEAQADNYYAKYRTGNNDKVDTTVEPIVKGGSASSGRGGGGGGKFGVHYIKE